MRMPGWAIKLFFGANVVILVLLLFSFPFLEPGTGSYVAAVLTLGVVLLAMTMIAVTVLVYAWLDKKSGSD